MSDESRRQVGETPSNQRWAVSSLDTTKVMSMKVRVNNLVPAIAFSFVTLVPFMSVSAFAGFNHSNPSTSPIRVVEGEKSSSLKLSIALAKSTYSVRSLMVVTVTFENSGSDTISIFRPREADLPPGILWYAFDRDGGILGAGDPIHRPPAPRVRSRDILALKPGEVVHFALTITIASLAISEAGLYQIRFSYMSPVRKSQAASWRVYKAEDGKISSNSATFTILAQ